MKADEMLLTPEQVAGRLQMKRGWVYRHARQLGAFHLGKYVRFSWPKVLKAIEHLALGAEPNDHDKTQN